MKLSYRDRIVILIAIIVVILGLGIFLLIKPAWQKLNKSKEEFETLNTEWDAKLLEFDRIPARQENIQQRYEEGKKLATEFTDEMSSVELDKFLRNQFINTQQNIDDEVAVKGNFDITDAGTSSLSYYYYAPDIVTYPLYESADLDGSLALEAAKKLLDSNILSARAAQTVGSSSSTFTLLINRKDTMDLLDAVKKYAEANKDAMLIESVTLKEADFNENLEEEEEEGGQQAEPETDEDGNPIAPAGKNDEKANTIPDVKKDYTEVTITYRAYYVQAPTKPDVGDKYDKTIWDGEGWRTAAAE